MEKAIMSIIGGVIIGLIAEVATGSVDVGITVAVLSGLILVTQ